MYHKFLWFSGWITCTPHFTLKNITKFCLHSFINRYLDHFFVLTTTDHAVMSTGTHISLRLLGIVVINVIWEVLLASNCGQRSLLYHHTPPWWETQETNTLWQSLVFNYSGTSWIIMCIHSQRLWSPTICKMPCLVLWDLGSGQYSSCLFVCRKVFYVYWLLKWSHRSSGFGGKFFFLGVFR